MTIIYLERLNSFMHQHANARRSLIAWKTAVEQASWRKKQDVLKDFPRAKMIRNNRARFEIVHTLYRLIAHIFYEDQIAEVRFIGTHDDYDKIDPSKI
ncbi:MAG: type II toxin-antitoxin system HigB family toxin [Candidatus Pseudobacter hemicellulosilyticus]|uniref:Type II toxin-antitoxin system HigB family toxin n=1 Tax=Candidatus Pseudobacter hemicellulosilyticus TaxID=3121375 RepID=A0AAJ6BHF3_9BACT|nr:MAG: type II toxin-antitoxin system HigB family toxin [Pseudobacter sp.]